MTMIIMLGYEDNDVIDDDNGNMKYEDIMIMIIYIMIMTINDNDNDDD